MVDTFGYQGVSNSVAENYTRRHGGISWEAIQCSIGDQHQCQKLSSYWNYVDCRYSKADRTCSEPALCDNCAVPRVLLRNGRLNQMAFSFYLFVRDVADGDLMSWIDDQLAIDSCDPTRSGNRLIDAMRNIFGVSDKVVSMTLSEVLMAAHKVKPNWFAVGSHMIAVDTLVHTFFIARVS